MGLHLKSVNWEWYIPIYGGNRASYEQGTNETPTEIEIRIPTYADSRDISRRLGLDGRLSDEDGKEVFARHIREIKNLVFDDRAITTGAELIALADRIDADFIVELNRAVNSSAFLNEGLRKNCESRRLLVASQRESAGIAGTAGVAG